MARGGFIVKQTGDFGDAIKFLKKGRKFQKRLVDILESFGREGLEALQEATPKRTGKTAKSWSYKVESGKGSYSLSFQNDNVFRGVPVAVLIVYGHVTPSGRWIEGRDFVTPVVDPLFEKLQKQIRKEAASW